MDFTINHWIAFGLVVIINLHQFFWGLSLKSSKEDSRLTLLSYFFPLLTMLLFGFFTGVVLVFAPEEAESIFGLFFAWSILTVLASIFLLVRYFKK